MQLTPAVTVRGLRHSQFLDNELRRRIHRLETYYPSIVGCHVLVERAQRHEAGNRYHVRVELTVPGEVIVVAHEPSQHAAAQQTHARRIGRVAEPGPERKRLLVAIHEAFDAARRQLQDYGRRRGKPHQNHRARRAAGALA